MYVCIRWKWGGDENGIHAFNASFYLFQLNEFILSIFTSYTQRWGKTHRYKGAGYHIYCIFLFNKNYYSTKLNPFFESSHPQPIFFLLFYFFIFPHSINIFFISSFFTVIVRAALKSEHTKKYKINYWFTQRSLFQCIFYSTHFEMTFRMHTTWKCTCLSNLYTTLGS